MDHNVMKSAAQIAGHGWKSIAWWKEAHRLQLALCDDLEAIADSLPSNIINHDCLFAAKCLVRLIRDVHAYEEETLFPALGTVFQSSPEFVAAVDRLTFEHLTDECYADDIVSLSPGRVALFGYAHVPWMKKHQQMIPDGSLPDGRARFALMTRATEMLVAGGYDAIGIDHFARPDDSLAIAAREGRLRRNFQGYTDDPATAIIGLGASRMR